MPELSAGTSIEERIKLAQRVREISVTAFTDALECLTVIEVLGASNKNGTNACINLAGAGLAGATIQRSLFTRLHLIVSRAYSKQPRPTDANAEVAFQILREDEGVLDEVQNSEDSKKNLLDAINIWRQNRASHLYQRFMEFRNTQLAHIGQRDESVPLPLYGEVFEFSRMTVAAIAKLANGTGVAIVSMESQIPMMTRSAEAFWRPWTQNYSTR